MDDNKFLPFFFVDCDSVKNKAQESENVKNELNETKSELPDLFKDVKVGKCELIEDFEKESGNSVKNELKICVMKNEVPDLFQDVKVGKHEKVEDIKKDNDSLDNVPCGGYIILSGLKIPEENSEISDEDLSDDIDSESNCKVVNNKRKRNKWSNVQEERPYICKICKRTYRKKFLLDAHKKTHSRLLKFDCDLCSKQFSYRTYLMKHKWLSHSKKKYSCKVCEKSFATENKLKAHKEIHTNDMLKCHICMKNFSYRNSLVKHIKKNHLQI